MATNRSQQRIKPQVPAKPVGPVRQVLRWCIWPVVRGDGSIRSGWKTLAFVLGTSFVSQLMTLIWVKKLHWPGNPWLPFSVLGTLLVTLGFLRSDKKTWAWAGIGLWGKARIRQFLLGILLAAGIAIVLHLVLWAFGIWAWSISPEWHQLTGKVKFSYFAAIGIFMGMVAFYEELMTRGYPLQLLRDAIGEQGALLGMSIVFAFLHIFNPGMVGNVAFVALLNLMLAGMILGLMAIRLRSLSAGIGFHLAWNYILAIMGSAVSGSDYHGPLRVGVNATLPTWLTGGGFGVEGSVLCTVLFFGSALALAYRLPKAVHVDDEKGRESSEGGLWLHRRITAMKLGSRRM